MTADGLSEADVDAVIDQLAMLRINEMIPTKHHILDRMLQAVAARPTAMDIDVAQGTYLRGMALALAEIDRRYGGVRVEDQDLVDRMMLARNDPPKALGRPKLRWWIVSPMFLPRMVPRLSRNLLPSAISRSLQRT